MEEKSECTNREAEEKWAWETARRLLQKVRVTAVRNRHKIPYTTVDGVFDDCSAPDRISWWTNGFWAGLLWQLYSLSGEEQFAAIAKETEDKLDACLMSYMGMDHDSGFRWLLTAGADYRLTGNERSKNRMLLAAANLAGRFNPAGGFIRAWNDPGDGNSAGWAIIDCMMNLPLLYRASELTKDPRFSQIAVRHADTASAFFVREDGSVNHIVRFDPETGAFLGSLGGQGMAEGSVWTRGQAWALYGFTLSYLHTGKETYLKTARRTAAYFISHIPKSGHIPVDFCQPADCMWEDSTAAAIAASGLLEMERFLEGSEASRVHEAAARLLRTLAATRCCFAAETDHILEKCTAAYHDEKHEFAIIYGDYFFTEAILKLCGKGIFLW